MERRWKQVKNAFTPIKNVILEIQQPQCMELYYDVAAAIDEHNKQCHMDLVLEKYVCINDWLKRVNASLFGTSVVDAMNVHQQIVAPNVVPKNLMTNVQI